MPRIPGFDAMDHVGITVPDLEQAVEFFTSVLGAEECYREGPEKDDGDAMWRQLRVDPRASLRLAMVKLGSSTTIELLEYTVAGGKARAVAPSNADHSAAHIGFRVRHIDEAAAYLRAAAGVEVLEGPVTVPGGPSAGLRWIYFVTPWGAMMELVQLPDVVPA